MVVEPGLIFCILMFVFAIWILAHLFGLLKSEKPKREIIKNFTFEAFGKVMILQVEGDLSGDWSFVTPFSRVVIFGDGPRANLMIGLSNGSRQIAYTIQIDHNFCLLSIDVPMEGVVTNGMDMSGEYVLYTNVAGITSMKKTS